MDRQTLRDWVIRFNDQGPDGLINKSSPGAPGKLSKEHKAFLARLVEEGPIPAIHGVVRWRACDLIMRLHEEFGISVSDDTVYRALRELGFSHVSARPKAYKQDFAAVAFTLPVQRLVLAKLLEQDHGQKVRSGKATGRHVERCRRLRDRLAVPARELLAHRL